MVCFVVFVEFGEKLGMMMVIFFIFVVFMIMISLNIFKLFEYVFKFGIFMIMYLLMSGLIIMLEVFVINIYYKLKDMKMNGFYKWMFRYFVDNDKNDNEILVS